MRDLSPERFCLSRPDKRKHLALISSEERFDDMFRLIHGRFVPFASVGGLLIRCGLDILDSMAHLAFSHVGHTFHGVHQVMCVIKRLPVAPRILVECKLLQHQAVFVGLYSNGVGLQLHFPSFFKSNNLISELPLRLLFQSTNPFSRLSTLCPSVVSR